MPGTLSPSVTDHRRKICLRYSHHSSVTWQRIKHNHVITEINNLLLQSWRLLGFSAKFMAFNWDTHGAALAILPLDAQGQMTIQYKPFILRHVQYILLFWPPLHFFPTEIGSLKLTFFWDTALMVFQSILVDETPPKCFLSGRQERSQVPRINAHSEMVPTFLIKIFLHGPDIGHSRRIFRCKIEIRKFCNKTFTNSQSQKSKPS